MTNIYLVHIDNTPNLIEGAFLNRDDAEQLAGRINFNLSINTDLTHKAYVEEISLIESFNYEDNRTIVNAVYKEFKDNIPQEGIENILLALPKDTPNNWCKSMSIPGSNTIYLITENEEAMSRMMNIFGYKSTLNNE